MHDFLTISYRQAQTDLLLLDALKKADFSNGFRLEHSLHYETAAAIIPDAWRQKNSINANEIHCQILLNKTHPVLECLNKYDDNYGSSILYCYPGIPCDKCYEKILEHNSIKTIICFEASEHIYGINDKSIYHKSLNKIMSKNNPQIIQYPYPYNSENGIQLIDNFNRIYK